jgi:phosphoglycerate dehydrogenase-like enzyme
MKRGAYLINTSRGGIVDEDALLSAIQQGTLSGAALDVRSQEPSLKTDKLLDESRILLTPHISGLTREAGVRTATTVAEDVLRVLRGQPPMAAV